MSNDRPPHFPDDATDDHDHDPGLPDHDHALPPLDFTTFILSLSSTVLSTLGEIPNPDGSRSPVNLSLARQTIDLLGLLQTKTRGNLSGEEERLLNQILVDLRLKYVDVAGKAASKKK